MRRIAQITDRTLLKLLVAYALLQPFLDILTWMTADSGAVLSAGAVARAGFVLAEVLYILCCGDFRGKEAVRGFLVLICCYFAAFTLFQMHNGGLSAALKDLSGMLKTFYSLVFGLTLYTVWRRHHAAPSLHSTAVSCGIYCLCIVLACATGTSNCSYNAGYGYCGWFYSANDISSIVTISGPLLLNPLLEAAAGTEKMKKKWAACYVLLTACMLFSTIAIGTKMVFLGLVTYTAVSAIWFTVRALHRRAPGGIRAAAAAALICVLLCGLYTISPLRSSNDNLYFPLNGSDQEAYEESLQIAGVRNPDRAAAAAEMEAAAENTWLGELIEASPAVSRINKILSNRLKIAAPVLQEYLDQPVSVKLLGLGYADKECYSAGITHMIELEPVAVLLRQGIVGALLLVLPLFLLFAMTVLRFLRSFRACMSDHLCCSLFYICMLCMMNSLIIGHAFTMPTCSFFIVLVFQSFFLCCCERCPVPMHKGSTPNTEPDRRGAEC